MALIEGIFRKNHQQNEIYNSGRCVKISHNASNCNILLNTAPSRFLKKQLVNSYQIILCSNLDPFDPTKKFLHKNSRITENIPAKNRFTFNI